ncbi:MAG: TIGR02584 family CRISPR-associated protein [Verrucomicrobia bacterium]|nr:TIGR02584 family CRISPR-associated protein [Verrucomicrobiota bacterium]
MKPVSRPHLSPDPFKASPAPVLLAVTGMSPAVLTETIWALAQEQDPIIPARVLVVTTADGRRELERQLFGPDPSMSGATPWEALRSALTAAGHDLRERLRFGTTGDDIRVITGTDSATGRSRELLDLRTPSDNAAAADFLLEQVRGIVENPDTPLIASLAGGRKTMGALLYACLTLAGRETDRLTHVLVNEPFDALRGFWFPRQPGGPLADRSGALHPPGDARVELADVPFVPLRNLFHRELGRRAGSFLKLVEECREQVRRTAGESVRLTLDPSRCEIDVNGTPVRLAPREHLILLCLATRARQGEPALGSYKDAVPVVDAFRAPLSRSAPPKNLSDWRHGIAVSQPFLEDQELRRALSSLARRLRETGGNAPLLAPCLPEKGRFSLTVPAELIFIR